MSGILNQRLTQLFAALAVLLVACGGEARLEREATPTVLQVASNRLKLNLDTRYLPHMAPALAELVREQPWYAEVTQAEHDLVVMIQNCERKAMPRGAALSVLDMLRFATEQSWYTDGLDEREAIGLTGVFEAYARSLEDPNAPAIGTVLSSTLRNGHFDVVPLAESGNVVLLVSSAKPDLGAKTLAIGVDALPKIEKITGKFPYRFLHLNVIPAADLEEDVLGASYNEFIEIGDTSVETGVIVHEITHSTLYGIFPLWFEEGFAHFLQYHFTTGLDAGAREYAAILRRAGRETKLDLRPNRPGGLYAEVVERPQGFLFLKALSDIRGVEGISKLMRSLRTRSLTDQELMRAIVADGTPEEQAKTAQLVCQQVIGTTRNYCTP